MTATKRKMLRIGQALLLSAAALLTAVCIMTLTQRAGAREEMTDVLDRYAAAMDAKEGAEQDGEGDTRSQDTAPKVKSPQDQQVERISKRHVFSPEPPPKPKKKFPLTGVLGDLAFFGGGEGQKVGQSYNGAKIKEIGPDWVELEVDGKVQKVYVFKPSSGGPSPGPSRGAPGRGPKPPDGVRRLPPTLGPRRK